MLIPPHYLLTPKIVSLLQTIEAARQIVDAFPIPPEIETNIRRHSVLKSSLFSARIEGNPLTLADLARHPSTDQKKREVMNILKGLEFIHERGARDLTVNVILQTHQKVMNGLTDYENLGQFRREVSAIFNTAGIAIYMPPPPTQIKYLMERLLKFTNGAKEQFIPIRACLAHYSFEKIHPFLDGNGRLGRLIFQAVLEKGGYGMKGLLPVEEYLDTHREGYYDALAESERDITSYVEFMLTSLAETAEKTKKLILAKEKTTPEDYLLPRRAEILTIIKEQKLINFDSLHRRFMKVNERTLRYDLKKLVDAGLVKKLGTTNGVYYEAV